MKAFASIAAGMVKDSGLFAWLSVLHFSLLWFALKMLQPSQQAPADFMEAEEAAAQAAIQPNPTAGWFALILLAVQCAWVALALRNSRKDFLAANMTQEVKE